MAIRMIVFMIIKISLSKKLKKGIILFLQKREPKTKKAILDELIYKYSEYIKQKNKYVKKYNLTLS